MPLHLVPLLLTILAVVALGIVAVICSTSGGANWLQRQWKGDAAAPGVGNGRAASGGESGANGLAGPADALGDAIERGDGGHGPEDGRLAGHPVDDA